MMNFAPTVPSLSVLSSPSLSIFSSTNYFQIDKKFLHDEFYSDHNKEKRSWFFKQFPNNYKEIQTKFYSYLNSKQIQIPFFQWFEIYSKEQSINYPFSTTFSQRDFQIKLKDIGEELYEEFYFDYNLFKRIWFFKHFLHQSKEILNAYDLFIQTHTPVLSFFDWFQIYALINSIIYPFEYNHISFSKLPSFSTETEDFSSHDIAMDDMTSSLLDKNKDSPLSFSSKKEMNSLIPLSLTDNIEKKISSHITFMSLEDKIETSLDELIFYKIPYESPFLYTKIIQGYPMQITFPASYLFKNNQITSSQIITPWNPIKNFPTIKSKLIPKKESNGNCLAPQIQCGTQTSRSSLYMSAQRIQGMTSFLLHHHSIFFKNILKIFILLYLTFMITFKIILSYIIFHIQKIFIYFFTTHDKIPHLYMMHIILIYLSTFQNKFYYPIKFLQKLYYHFNICDIIFSHITHFKSTLSLNYFFTYPNTYYKRLPCDEIPFYLTKSKRSSHHEHQKEIRASQKDCIRDIFVAKFSKVTYHNNEGIFGFQLTRHPSCRDSPQKFSNTTKETFNNESFMRRIQGHCTRWFPGLLHSPQYKLRQNLPSESISSSSNLYFSFTKVSALSPLCHPLLRPMGRNNSCQNPSNSKKVKRVWVQKSYIPKPNIETYSQTTSHIQTICDVNSISSSPNPLTNSSPQYISSPKSWEGSGDSVFSSKKSIKWDITSIYLIF